MSASSLLHRAARARSRTLTHAPVSSRLGSARAASPASLLSRKPVLPRVSLRTSRSFTLSPLRPSHPSSCFRPSPSPSFPHLTSLHLTSPHPSILTPPHAPLPPLPPNARPLPPPPPPPPPFPPRRPYGLPVPYRALFAHFETLLRKHGGRPHWAKTHPLGPAALRARYARFADFVRVLERVDPRGTFRNPYVRRHLFGAAAPADGPRVFKAVQ